MTTQAICALRDKRAEVAGQVIDLEKRLAEARGNLLHVDACLRLLGWTDPIETIKPKQVTPRSIFGRNELQRILFDQMREHPPGVTIRSIAETICGMKGWDSANRPFMDALVHRIGGNLQKLKRQGRAVTEVSGAVGVWRLATT